ncbi:MAG: hypothetical protein CMJ67_01355 [Planctomycetaceae bacterium]|nr:hypothetical protein [Planctomycetaceae bacterium]
MNDPEDNRNDWEHEGYEDSSEDQPDAEAYEDGELPYGMSGVTGILERLSKGVELGTWPQKKCRMVAEYVLSISDDYWLSTDEVSYCRRLLV